mgnify:CR=1 FL=1
MTKKLLPQLRLHPARCFGKPTIGDSRLYVQVVAEAWWYGRTEREIYKSWPTCKGKRGLLLACWWMARYGPRSWRVRWKDWLESVEGELWKLNYDVPLPTQKQ